MNHIFRSSDSPCRKLRCAVESDGSSVWMYLHDLQRETVIGDAPICSLKSLIALEEFKASYKGSGAPPLVTEYTSSDAVHPALRNDQVGFVWDSDEHSVVVTIDSSAVSKIVEGEKHGYSIYTLKNGPWGQPWN